MFAYYWDASCQNYCLGTEVGAPDINKYFKHYSEVIDG